MKVTLLAATSIEIDTEFHGMDERGLISMDLNEATEEWMQSDRDAGDLETLVEFAGRACYQSFHKPNPATRENKDYLANILKQKHESVLEHATATFYVEGVSRALTHELIRHRHLNFSQLSQRFVDGSESDLVIPPAYVVDYENDSKELQHLKQEAQAKMWDIFEMTRQGYETLVELGEEMGLPRKQNREAARAVMPNATETKIVVSGNMRAWRDVLAKRYSTHADAEIRQFAGEVLKQLRELAPGIFQDFPEEPLS